MLTCFYRDGLSSFSHHTVRHMTNVVILNSPVESLETLIWYTQVLISHFGWKHLTTIQKSSIQISSFVLIEPLTNGLQLKDVYTNMIWWLDITYWGLRVKGQGQSDDWSKWPVRLITRQLLCLSNVLKHYSRVMYDPYMNTFELVLSGQWTRSRSALLQKLLGLIYNTRCIYIS